MFQIHLLHRKGPTMALHVTGRSTGFSEVTGAALLRGMPSNLTNFFIKLLTSTGAPDLYVT